MQNNYTQLTEDKTQKVLEFINKMEKSRNVKKGINEATKCVNKGTAKLVIIASDSQPIEITAFLSVICEDKGVDFVHVASKVALGKACNVNRPVVACCIFVPKDQESLRIEEKIKALLK